MPIELSPTKKNIDLEAFSLICIPPDIKKLGHFDYFKKFLSFKILNYLCFIHIAFLMNSAEIMIFCLT